MQKSTLTGKFIISAGEVGAYSVCPEAWRLRMVEKVRSAEFKEVSEGKRLHREWASNFDETLLLVRRTKLVVALLLLAVCIYVLFH